MPYWGITFLMLVPGKNVPDSRNQAKIACTSNSLYGVIMIANTTWTKIPMMVMMMMTLCVYVVVHMCECMYLCAHAHTHTDTHSETTGVH